VYSAIWDTLLVSEPCRPARSYANQKFLNEVQRSCTPTGPWAPVGPTEPCCRAGTAGWAGDKL